MQISDVGSYVDQEPPASTLSFTTHHYQLSRMIPRPAPRILQRRQITSAAHNDAYASLVSRKWASAPTDGSAIKNFIGGRFVESKATSHFDVLDPVSRLYLI